MDNTLYLLAALGGFVLALAVVGVATLARRHFDKRRLALIAARQQYARGQLDSKEKQK